MRYTTKLAFGGLVLLLTLSATSSFGHDLGFFNTYWDPNNAHYSPGLALRYTHRFTDHWGIGARWYWFFDISDTRAYEIEPTSISLGPTYFGRISDELEWYLNVGAAAWWLEQEEDEENEEQIYDYGYILVAGVEKEICESWALFAEIHHMWVSAELELDAVGSGNEEDVTLNGAGFGFGLMHRW